MRTTVEIDDALLIQVKRVAAESRRTIRAVIEDALRADLAKPRARQRRAGGERVITFKGKGVRPGVNLDSAAELLDLMEEAR
jgi:Arc/MetJ family transcription regulator